MTNNPIFTLINSIFTGILDGVTTLVSGATGQVVIGLTAVGFLIALVVLVKGVFSKSKPGA